MVAGFHASGRFVQGPAGEGAAEGEDGLFHYAAPEFAEAGFFVEVCVVVEGAGGWGGVDVARDGHDGGGGWVMIYMWKDVSRARGLVDGVSRGSRWRC